MIKNKVHLDLNYRHQFTDASNLLHSICRSHYCLTYEQWKDIFEDVLEQIRLNEVIDRELDKSSSNFFEGLTSDS